MSTYEIIAEKVARIIYSDGKRFIVFPYGTRFKLTPEENYFSRITNVRRYVSIDTDDFNEAISIALSL